MFKEKLKTLNRNLLFILKYKGLSIVHGFHGLFMKSKLWVQVYYNSAALCPVLYEWMFRLRNWVYRSERFVTEW